jgi:hypothetical protein
VDFQIDCPCGQRVTVNEGAADGTADCVCGQSIRVPSLKEMRVRAGLPPFNISPELLIENILRSEEIPWDRRCVRCCVRTEDVIEVVTACERVWVKEAGSLSWPALVFATLLSPFLAAIWSSRRGELQQFGKDKVYPLPLPVCNSCQKKLTTSREIKDCLAVVPAYRQLLAKFPDATVEVTEYRHYTVLPDDPTPPSSATSFKEIK